MTRPTTPFDRVTAADNAINGAQQMRADLRARLTAVEAACDDMRKVLRRFYADDKNLRLHQVPGLIESLLDCAFPTTKEP